MSWITINGKHIQIGKGESKSDVIKSITGSKASTKKSKYKGVKKVKPNKKEKKGMDLRNKVNEVSFLGGVRAYNKKHNTNITSKDVQKWKNESTKAETSYMKRNKANYNTRVKIGVKRMQNKMKK